MSEDFSQHTGVGLMQDLDRLGAYVEGKLSTEEMAETEAYIARAPLLQDMVEGLRELDNPEEIRGRIQQMRLRHRWTQQSLQFGVGVGMHQLKLGGADFEVAVGGRSDRQPALQRLTHAIAAQLEPHRPVVHRATFAKLHRLDGVVAVTD